MVDAPPPLEAPGFDPSMLRELRGLDADGGTLRTLLGMFCEAVDEQLAALHRGRADRDGEAIAHAAHRLKGGARSVGAVALGDACEAVEKDAGASAALWPAVEEEAARAAAGARMLMAAMA